MFIGYPRSSHSLVGSILDAHPEIIIPHEYDVITKWEKYRSSTLIQNKLQKYRLFFDLHHFSTKQAMFGLRASVNTGNYSHYNYKMPELWQGGYQKGIKVS